MENPLISIVVGHTHKSPGAMGVAPLSMTEYEYNRELSMIICDMLIDEYRCYVSFRDEIGVNAVYNELDLLKPDLSIELHFNSSAGNAHGTECLCVDRSRDFARTVQKCLCMRLKRIGITNRGVKILQGEKDLGWHSVSRLSCPNVLVEPFFGSSPEDAQLGLDSQDDIALALKNAIDQYFKR